MRTVSCLAKTFSIANLAQENLAYSREDIFVHNTGSAVQRRLESVEFPFLCLTSIYVDIGSSVAYEAESSQEEEEDIIIDIEGDIDVALLGKGGCRGGGWQEAGWPKVSGLLADYWPYSDIWNIFERSSGSNLKSRHSFL